MRKLLILGAGVALAACAHRGEETGAAPDRGDTTTVTSDTTRAPGDTTNVTHAIDSTRTGPPGVTGRPPNGTVTLDSTAVTGKPRPDSVVQGAAQDTSFVGQDTSRPGGPGELRDSLRADSTSAVTDTTQAVGHDSTGAPQK
jgi:hypothetical protein